MTKSRIFIFFSLLIIALLAVFAWKNQQPAIIDLMFREVELPMAAIIFGSFILGALMVLLSTLAKKLKLQGETKVHKERIDKLETMLQKEMLKNHEIKAAGLGTTLTTNTDAAINPKDTE